MTDININEVYEELKYLGELPETSRLIKDYLALQEEDEKLRAIIGELADALDGFMDAPCDSCMLNRCPGIEKCKETKGTIELVAKARKMIGGAE